MPDIPVTDTEVLPALPDVPQDKIRSILIPFMFAQVGYNFQCDEIPSLMIYSTFS